jgi:hypothetical protein
MPYVWGLPKLIRNSKVTAESGMYVAAAGGWTQEDISYADFIMDLWTNFAKYGFVKLRLYYILHGWSIFCPNDMHVCVYL